MAKHTTRTTTTRPPSHTVSDEARLRAAYEAHTLSQMLYGHLVGHPAWGASAPMAAPETIRAYGMTPGMTAWGAGFPASPRPEPLHGFGLDPVAARWTGAWHGYAQPGPTHAPFFGPYCMTGYWKP